MIISLSFVLHHWGITDPFLQAKVLRLLRLFGERNAEPWAEDVNGQTSVDAQQNCYLFFTSRMHFRCCFNIFVFSSWLKHWKLIDEGILRYSRYGSRDTFQALDNTFVIVPWPSYWIRYCIEFRSFQNSSCRLQTGVGWQKSYLVRVDRCTHCWVVVQGRQRRDEWYFGAGPPPSRWSKAPSF